jgi:hypothetical protein
MRAILRLLVVSAALAAATIAQAQMHKVAKPEQVVRAVGVYEWTGDFAKPTASRLIPISLFIEGHFEDAGIYIARPVPFALLTGNVYILQSAGIDKGTLDLAYARHLQAVDSTGDLAFDDGWFGYGSVKPLAASRKAAALKPSKTLPVLTASNNGPHFGSKPASGSTTTPADDKSGSKPTAAPASGTPASSTPAASTSTSDDSDRPTMKRRGTDPASSSTPATSTPNTTTAPADDPDRPTMKRRDSTGSDSSTASATGTSSTPADDPDRPTMKRRGSDTSAAGTDTSTTSTTTASTSKSGDAAPADDPDRPTMKRRDSTNTASTTTADSNAPVAADDPDRPTLKRHTAAEAKKAAANDVGGVSAIGSLNDDPSRPNLHRGKPTSSMTEADLPKLTGLPANLHQMVAVSDAANRDPHPFTLEWDDEAQHQAILQKMQLLARAKLAAYGVAPAPASSTPAPAAKKPPVSTTARSRRAAAPAAPSIPLLDEDLKAYTLSYGGAATYIYSANTGGTGAALRYVTIVAQADGLGDIKPAIQSVTDAAHLDRSPKMQFVDVVDAEASNRASLLFELRGHTARQFALYRVIASHPEQIFLTGTTQ